MTSDDQQRAQTDDDPRAGAAGDGGGGGASREDGYTGRRGTSFDPTPHIQQLRGRGGNQDYLGVRWSLVWLRKEHPDAQIVTEHVRIDDKMAIFKAAVSLPTGGMATGYGSETATDFGDFIEKAETKAIGRALRALGYGATNSDGGDEGEAQPPTPPVRRPGATTSPRRQPTPIERPAASGRTAPAARQASGEGRPATERPVAAERPTAAERPSPVPEQAAPRATPERAPSARSRPPAPDTGTQAADQTVSERSLPERAAPDGEPVALPRRAEPAVPPPGVSRPARATDDADLADYSWSAFWPWARSIGLLDKKAIEDLIGRTTDNLLPAELRGLILAARGES